MGEPEPTRVNDASSQGRKAWFAPKRIGYGSGLPIAWQGWVTLALYFAVLIGAVALPSFPSLFLVVAATVALVVVCYTRTAGGWRWRNG